MIEQDISEVDQTLKAKMRRLEQGARIRKFVPLLAIRRAKELSAHTPQAA
jgi:uncharacterized protein DUF3562